MNILLERFSYKLVIVCQIIFVSMFCLNFASATNSLVGDFSSCDCAQVIEKVKQSGGEYQEETPCYKYCTGNYEVNDFVQILINGVNILFGLVGSLTLIMFIYGGVMFLVSSGNTERVTKAKQILINAIIGLIIIFTSYLIIQFVLVSLGYTNSSWFTAPK
jgi:hypothetical protein